MIQKRYDTLEFICPFCKKTHNIRDWVESEDVRMDTEFTMENLSDDGRVRISFPYMECECGAMYIIDIETGFVTIYDDSNNIVFEEGYRVKK